MARQRFARILEAAKLYSAVDNYVKYITDSTKRGTKVGSGRSRAASQSLYLKPFGQDLAATQRVRATSAKPTWDLVKSQASVSSRVSETAPANGNDLIKLGGYKSPRVIVATGRSTSGIAKTSAVTGLKYLSYGGKSTSFPFGKKDAADDLVAAFNEIKTDLQDVSAFTGGIFTLQEEQV